MNSVLNLNGIEIELPEGASVNVSEDGKKVKVQFAENATEKIRVVEKQGPERIVEKIRFIEKYIPCPLQHYPSYSPCTLPHYPCTRPHYPTYPYPWYYYSGNISVSGGYLSSDNIIYTTIPSSTTSTAGNITTTTSTPFSGWTYTSGTSGSQLTQ